MIKLFDKRIAQSTKGQIIALFLVFALLCGIGAIIGLNVLEVDNPDSAKFGYRGTWGLMQCVDGGFVDATISTNTKLDSNGEKISKNAPVWVVFVSLGFWLGGMILISFFTGVATEFLNTRREKILKGSVSYFFVKNYILIVGYDFQTRNLIKSLLAETSASKPDIVLVTDVSVEDIYGTLLPDLQPSDVCRLFIMRKDITMDDSYKDFDITGAEEIYIIGDGEGDGRDGKTLQALDTVSRAAKRDLLNLLPQIPQKRQIKVYLHIEDSVLYSNIRAIKLSMDALLTRQDLIERQPALKRPMDELLAKANAMFDLDVFNYYESWAWECWSNKNSSDGNDAYLPIRHAKETEHAELFVIGAGHMGRAMVNFAMPLMNYGGSGKHCKITVFDPDESKSCFLPAQKTLDALPELEVVCKQLDGCSDEANAMILEAAQKQDTSVTVVIALPKPEAAIRAYMAFPQSLCRENISVLVWQATESWCVPNKSYLKMGGTDSKADKRQLRYFGMTDHLPWKNPARFSYGMAINYFYSCWFEAGAPVSPNATDADFVVKAKSMWNQTQPEKSEYNGIKAGEKWTQTPRWRKWSSVNCGDTFREKSNMFKEGVPETAERVLKAEHNRWWTDRILNGWLPSGQRPQGYDSHADKVNMIHGDMIPFEELQDAVKDKDKIVIAAMAAFGFIENFNGA